MIQDIAPKRFFNEYRPAAPGANSKCLAFSDNQVLIKTSAEEITLPEYGEISAYTEKSTYLFRIDDEEFFLVGFEDCFIPDGYSYEKLQTVRRLRPKDTLFAVLTGFHLYVWYRDNKFCGRCGTSVEHSPNRRVLKCPACKNEIYPKIAPAVIVAVTDGDRILLTRYNGRAYKGYSLIAGFSEIGETPEETVVREVFEESGLRVKNIKYYASQPWGMASDLLLGYFCELDGSSAITIDAEELSMAGWYRRDEIDIGQDDVSLTSEMIQTFKNEK